MSWSVSSTANKRAKRDAGRGSVPPGLFSHWRAQPSSPNPQPSPPISVHQRRLAVSLLVAGSPGDGRTGEVSQGDGRFQPLLNRLRFVILVCFCSPRFSAQIQVNPTRLDCPPTPSGVPPVCLRISSISWSSPFSVPAPAQPAVQAHLRPLNPKTLPGPFNPFAPIWMPDSAFTSGAEMVGCGCEHEVVSRPQARRSAAADGGLASRAEEPASGQRRKPAPWLGERGRRTHCEPEPGYACHGGMV